MVKNFNRLAIKCENFGIINIPLHLTSEKSNCIFRKTAYKSKTCLNSLTNEELWLFILWCRLWKTVMWYKAKHILVVLRNCTLTLLEKCQKQLLLLLMFCCIIAMLLHETKYLTLVKNQMRRLEKQKFSSSEWSDVTESANHKHNEDSREEQGITDITTIIKPVPLDMARTCRKIWKMNPKAALWVQNEGQKITGTSRKRQKGILILVIWTGQVLDLCWWWWWEDDIQLV